jgi:hemerythrin
VNGAFRRLPGMEQPMLLMWTDNLSVGVKDFDEDHKRIIRIVNELHGAIEDAKDRGMVEPEEIEIALHRLENYVHYHCAQEEIFMQKTGYPELEEHEQEHRTFRAMVAAMQERFRGSTRTSDAIELMQALHDWVTHHIFVTDKKFTAHLHKHEIY